jgi:hypothetical protein
MTRALLQLFDRVLADHARHIEAGELHVITFVGPDIAREPNLSLIREVTKHAGGLFFEAIEMWEGVSERGDAVLEQVLTSLGAPNPVIGLDRDEAADIVRARYLDGPDPETSESARIFLGLVNTVLDRSLVEAEFSVVVYDEGELDVEHAQLAWELVTAQLRGLQLGRVRTLLVLVGAAQINYRRHCGRDRGVRFAVQGQTLVERRDWQNNLADIRRLADTTDPLVLFLAAGASVSSEMPLGDLMRDRAIRTLLGSETPDEELAERFFDYSRSIGLLLPGEEAMSMAEFRRGLTLERVLYLEQQDEAGNNYGPTMRHFLERHRRALERRGRSVRAVQEMAVLQRRLVLVTVNVDELVEDGLPDQFQVFAAESDFVDCADYVRSYLADGGRVPLLKLHGTVSNADSVVVSVDRVARGLTEHQIASLEALCGLEDDRRSWIYVGSSMRDRDLIQLFGLARYANGLEEWWVTPFEIPTINQFINEHRTQPWKDAGRRSTPMERTITETADVFLDEFGRLWTEQNQ